MDVKMISPWVRDESAFDPSATVRTVEVDGHLFTLRNVMGPGWFMHLAPAFGPEPRLHIDSITWEDWDQVAEAARRYLAEQGRAR